MKAAELRDLDDAELESRIENARKELFNLRFQAATGRLDNSARVSAVKREIARALTVQREREIEAAEALAAGRS
ncbi:MAG TPA: 50S ribosomal protein L29 [Acidimicrobiales bacterium]|nr:50S ribosomal protein L29 [Acidimicrobiales bacterium]